MANDYYLVTPISDSTARKFESWVNVIVEELM